MFLTLEGTEGVGKSTNLEVICACLTRAGVDFVRTREPGGTPFAEDVRDVLLKRRDEAVDPMAELLAVFAARAQHLNTVILPALAAGKWVVCDRFTDATYAYQGGGRGMSQSVIAQLETLVQGTVRPDAVVVLDVDPDVGLKRAGQRAEADRFELESLSFFARVRDVYRQRAEAAPDRYHFIDAGQTLEQVQTDLERLMARLIGEFGA